MITLQKFSEHFKEEGFFLVFFFPSVASALSGCRNLGQIVAIYDGNFQLNVFLKVTDFIANFFFLNHSMD